MPISRKAKPAADAKAKADAEAAERVKLAGWILKLKVDAEAAES
jgi:hypothetical protein